MPAILIGQHCRLCRSLIPNSIAGQPLNVVAAKISGTAIPLRPGKATYGSEATGFMCEKCLATEPVNLHQLENEISEFWVKDIEVDMGPNVAPPCARCGTIEGDTRVLEMAYEGRAAMLCPPCGAWYLRANREKIRGTKLEWELKLK